MAPTDDVGDRHRHPGDGDCRDAPREGSPADTASSARHHLRPRRAGHLGPVSSATTASGRPLAAQPSRIPVPVAGNSPARQYRVAGLGIAWVDTPSPPSSRPPSRVRLPPRPLSPLSPVDQHPGGGLPNGGHRLAETNRSRVLPNGLGPYPTSTLSTPPRPRQPNQSDFPTINGVLYLSGQNERGFLPNPLRQHPQNLAPQGARGSKRLSPIREGLHPNPLRQHPPDPLLRGVQTGRHSSPFGETLHPNPLQQNPPNLVAQQGSGVPLTPERLADLNYQNTRSDILSSPPDQIAEFRDHESSVYPFVPEPRRLYGQLVTVNRTRVFRATRRMQEWIASVTAGLNVPEAYDSEREDHDSDSHQDSSRSQSSFPQHGSQGGDGRMLPPPRPGQTGQDQNQSQGHGHGHYQNRHYQYQYQSESHSRGHTHNLNLNPGQMMDLDDHDPADEGAKHGKAQEGTTTAKEQNKERPMLQLGDMGSIGSKRPFDFDQLHVPRKRARVSDTVRRTFSKMSRLGSSHVPTVRRRADDTHTSYAEVDDEADENMNIDGDGDDDQDAVTTIVHDMDPKNRKGARFVLRDTARDVMAATREAFSRLSIASGVAQPEPPKQSRLQICILGDANAGKTALISRLMQNFFVETEPSTATDCRTVPVIASDERVVLLELWDFPGTPSPAGGLDRLRQLRAAFFHAAVLCYSIEDKRNPAAVVNRWKPFLDQGLVECPRFVLGLKRDTRPDHPTVELRFLEKPIKPASIEDGQNIANAVGAAGFGECSSKTGQNISEVWRAIVDSILAGLEAGRRERTRARRRDRAREVASEFFAKASRGFRR